MVNLGALCQAVNPDGGPPAAGLPTPSAQSGAAARPARSHRLYRSLADVARNDPELFARIQEESQDE
jgi:hypothetical protein